MKPITSLVLHIGVPKTGSSLLQGAMRKVRRVLRWKGITVVDRSMFQDLPNLSAWSHYQRADRSSEPFVQDLKAMVDAQRSRTRHGGRTVLLSNESASGRAHDFGAPFWPAARASVDDLVTALHPEETHVVVYVRRQDQLLESLYMERIHRGKVRRWKKWREKICSDDRVRYTELIEAVSNVPTVAKVTVRPFETIAAGPAAFVGDFLALVGQGRLVKRMHPDTFAPVNPSYTEPALEAALALNRLVETEEQVTEVRNFLRGLFPPECYPRPALFTDEERQALLETYRPDNEVLFARHLPNYPADAYWDDEGMALLRQMTASQAEGS